MLDLNHDHIPSIHILIENINYINIDSILINLIKIKKHLLKTKGKYEFIFFIPGALKKSNFFYSLVLYNLLKKKVSDLEQYLKILETEIEEQRQV